MRLTYEIRILRLASSIFFLHAAQTYCVEIGLVYIVLVDFFMRRYYIFFKLSFNASDRLL